MGHNRHPSARLYLLLLGLASQTETRESQPCVPRPFDAVARQVGRDDWIAPSYESSGPFLAVAYKPWPDGPAQTVITMTYLDPDGTAAGGERHPRLLLAKADSRNDRLFEHYDSDFREDASVAVSNGNLWLDTARYRLNPTVRAFGVVSRSVAHGTSCPGAGFNNLLTLVVPVGDGKLRPVLSTYLGQRRTLKGSVYSTGPGFEQEVPHLTLELGHRRPNGFTDLVVISRISDGETENGKPSRTVKRALHYDGEHYPFKEYSDFWHHQ